MNYITHCLAFYNLENLFDTIDDQDTLDDSFLPNSPKKWTENRYEHKLKKLSFAIHKMGNERTNKHPFAVGLAEIENKKVIQDLIQTKPLDNFNYDFIHYDSPDERGIDVALLYDKSVFKISHSEAIPLRLTQQDGSIDYTRDILVVKGELEGEEIHLIVNHWPSRRSGPSFSDHKRIEAAKLLQSIVGKIQEENSNAKVIVMGDLNANPKDTVLKDVLDTQTDKSLTTSENFFNPMERMHNNGAGSLCYKGEWNLFDQFLLSASISQEDNYCNFQFYKARIFDSYELKEWKKYQEGSPFRTYLGRKYRGGYSDHFPVLLYISKYTS